MPSTKEKFIRYTDAGEVQYLSHNPANLKLVRSIVDGGNYDVVEGFGVAGPDGRIAFYTDEPPKEEPTAPLVVNGAVDESEEESAEVEIATDSVDDESSDTDD